MFHHWSYETQCSVQIDLYSEYGGTLAQSTPSSRNNGSRLVTTRALECGDPIFTAKMMQQWQPWVVKEELWEGIHPWTTKNVKLSTFPRDYVERAETIANNVGR